MHHQFSPSGKTQKNEITSSWDLGWSKCSCLRDFNVLGQGTCTLNVQDTGYEERMREKMLVDLVSTTRDNINKTDESKLLEIVFCWLSVSFMHFSLTNNTFMYLYISQ